MKTCKKLILFLFLFYLSHSLSAQCLSGTYTIGKGDYDFEDLIALQKYITQNGFCGDVTFRMAAGEYEGGFELRSGHHVSFEPLIPGTEVIMFPSTKTHKSTILSVYKTNVSIQGINFHLSSGYNCIYIDGSDSVSVHHNKFRSLQDNHLESLVEIRNLKKVDCHKNIFIDGEQNLKVDYSKKVTINENYFVGGVYGIGMYLTDFSEIEMNKFYGQTDRAIDMYKAGNFVINQNRIQSDSLSYSIKVQIDTTRSINGKYEISNNTILIDKAGAVYIRPVSDEIELLPLKIFNNSIIFNKIGGGLEIYNIKKGSSIIHNTIKALPESYFQRSAIFFNRVDSAYLRNNNLVMYAHGGAILIFESYDNSFYADSDYNNFISNINDILWEQYRFKNQTATFLFSIEEIRDSLKIEENSVSVLPQFTAEEGGHLNLNSEIIDKGIGTEVMLDIDGDIRDDKPDIGADEAYKFQAEYDLLVKSYDDYKKKYCYGEHDADILLVNQGLQPIDSVLVIWKTISLIDSLKIYNSIGPEDTLNISLGKFNFDKEANFIEVEAIILDPQNNEDNVSNNNTVIFVPINELLPVIPNSSDTTICKGDSLVLKAGEFFNHWSNGSENRELIVKESGTYWYKYINSNGCEGKSIPINITVNEDIPVLDINFVTVGYTLLIENNSTNYDTMMWDFGDGKEQLEGLAHEYSNTGSYVVNVSAVKNSCFDSQSEEITVVNPFDGPNCITNLSSELNFSANDTYIKDNLVYATGSSRGVAKVVVLTTDMNLKYNVQLDGEYGESIIADSEGYVYVVIYGERSGFHLYKLDPSGNVLWRQVRNHDYWRFNRTSKVVIDSKGAIYWLYSEMLPNTTDNVGVIEKYNAQGQLIWKYLNPETYCPSTCPPWDMQIDSDNRIVFVQSYGMDFHLTKLDSSGVKQWSKNFEGSYADDFDIPPHLYINKEDIFLIKSIPNNISSSRTSLLKLDSNGSVQWEKTFTGFNTYIRSIAVNDHGDVYVLLNKGYSHELLKYNKSGQLLWSRISLDSYAHQIKLDNNGNVILTKHANLKMFDPNGFLLFDYNRYYDWDRIEVTSENDLIITGNYNSNDACGFLKIDLDSFLPTAAPHPPGNLRVISENDRIPIHFNWEEPDFKGLDGLAGYNIYRSDRTSSLNSELITSLEYVDEGLYCKEPYSYFVTAVDNRGNESYPSDHVGINLDCNIVSVENGINDQIVISPNPANHYLQITGSEQFIADLEQINLVDTKGRIIRSNYRINNAFGQPTIHVSIDEIPDGLIMVQIYSKNSILVRKVVIRR